MKELKQKIIATVFDVLFLAGIIGLFIRFFISLWLMDDDGMFIYGMCLVAITCTIIAVSILASTIASTWKPKKKTTKKQTKTKETYKLKAKWETPPVVTKEDIKSIEINDWTTEGEIIKIIDDQNEKGYEFLGKIVDPQNLRAYLKFRRRNG